MSYVSEFLRTHKNTITGAEKIRVPTAWPEKMTVTCYRRTKTDLNRKRRRNADGEADQHKKKQTRDTLARDSGE